MNTENTCIDEHHSFGSGLISTTFLVYMKLLKTENTKDISGCGKEYLLNLKTIISL